MDEPEITAVRIEGTDVMGPLVALPSSPPWVRTDPQIIERLERIEAKLDAVLELAGTVQQAVSVATASLDAMFSEPKES